MTKQPTRALRKIPLRINEQHFADKYAGGLSPRAAYLETHDCAGKSDDAIKQAGYRLLSTDRVKAYIAKITDEAEIGERTINIHVKPSVNETSPIIELKGVMDAMDSEAMNVSPHGQMKKLEVAYWYSMTGGKFNSAISAVKAQNELAGFLTQRHEISVKNLDGASDSDLAAMQEDIRREMIDLGLNPDSGIFEMLEKSQKVKLPVTQRQEQKPLKAGGSGGDGAALAAAIEGGSSFDEELEEDFE